MTNIIKEIIYVDYRALREVRQEDEEYQKSYQKYVQAEDQLNELLNKLEGVNSMETGDKIGFL